MIKSRPQVSGQLLPVQPAFPERKEYFSAWRLLFGGRQPTGKIKIDNAGPMGVEAFGIEVPSGQCPFHLQAVLPADIQMAGKCAAQSCPFYRIDGHPFRVSGIITCQAEGLPAFALVGQR